jgi:hypothetical protein
MHDREEQATLKAATAALGRGDQERALKLLQSRLAKLNRRVEARGGDSDSESDSEADDGDAKVAAASEADRSKHEGGGGGGGQNECLGGEDAVRSASHLGDRVSCMTAEDWEKVSGGLLSAGKAPSLAVGRVDIDAGTSADAADAGAEEAQLPEEGEKMASYRKCLDDDGFFLAGGAESGAMEDATRRLMHGLKGLREAGIPPFYIWMYDEAWEVMLSVWRRVESIMGGQCLLEPTVAAYHLRHRWYSSGATQKIRFYLLLPLESRFFLRLPTFVSDAFSGAPLAVRGSCFPHEI